MAPLVLRCQYKGGKRSVIEGLSGDSTVEQLQEKIWLLTDVPVYAQRILSGFPPKEVHCTDKHCKLSSLDIRSGDTLIVEEDKKARRGDNETSLSDKASGKLTRKAVPADNSCLFASVSYVMLGDTSFASELRELTAQCVSSDPQTYNAGFLGKENKEYCTWIQSKHTWGGGIELSILSRHYQTEIAAVDTETSRVDRFGEDAGYTNRVFLIYNGIHYDPLAVLSSDNSSQPLQSVFPVNDDQRLNEAVEIAFEAQKKRHFTNLSKFTLRCMVCQTPLVGQESAVQHASATGHQNFGEV